MSSEKSLAIVLRVIEFSETSCIVTLMTRDFGKVTAIAKGARRPKSPFEAAIDVLAICRIVFIHKSSTAMDVLTEAKLERRFRSGTCDLNRLYAGYYVAELLKSLVDDADPHPDLFDLAVATLEQIDDATSKYREPEHKQDVGTLGEILLNFELKALESLGHLPMLTRCVGCGRPKRTLNRVSFGLNAGGLLCQTCRAGERNVVSLSSGGLALMLNRLGQRLETEQVNGQAVAEKEAEFDLIELPVETKQDGEAADEVRRLVRNYITHLIGHPPRLHKYLTKTPE